MEAESARLKPPATGQGKHVGYMNGVEGLDAVSTVQKQQMAGEKTREEEKTGQAEEKGFDWGARGSARKSRGNWGEKKARAPQPGARRSRRVVRWRKKGASNPGKEVLDKTPRRPEGGRRKELAS